MHRADGCVLRKEERSALQVFHERPTTVRSCRNLGELAKPAGDWERTFCIITVEANDLVRKIHDRMPAIIAASEHQRWFDGFDDLLVPYPTEKMSAIPA
jgi:putative SOS response-associated peptidase YedK